MNKIGEELMQAANGSFYIVYSALKEAAKDYVQSGSVNKVNKKKVLSIIERIKNENNHSR
jgi:hypothetical protein